MSPGDPNSRPVYSSDEGELCPDCASPRAACRCSPAHRELPRGDRIRIAFESKGRGGKAVSLITGLPLEESELKVLAKALKKACGTGGAVKDGVIEIQGDHRAKLEGELARRGFRSRIAGGSRE